MVATASTEHSYWLAIAFVIILTANYIPSELLMKNTFWIIIFIGFFAGFGLMHSVEVIASCRASSYRGDKSYNYNIDFYVIHCLHGGVKPGFHSNASACVSCGFRLRNAHNY